MLGAKMKYRGSSDKKVCFHCRGEFKEYLDTIQYRKGFLFHEDCVDELTDAQINFKGKLTYKRYKV